MRKGYGAIRLKTTSIIKGLYNPVFDRESESINTNIFTESSELVFSLKPRNSEAVLHI
jgi:hypothetical protein